MVARALSHRSLEQPQFAGIRIEAGANTEGKGPLGGDMPYGKAIGDGNAERLEIGGQHFIEAERSVTIGSLHLGEAPDDHPAKPFEDVDESEVREHAIYPVQVLSHVFQEEDGAVQRREIRSPDEAMHQGEIPAG